MWWYAGVLQGEWWGYFCFSEAISPVNYCNWCWTAGTWSRCEVTYLHIWWRLPFCTECFDAIFWTGSEKEAEGNGRWSDFKKGVDRYYTTFVVHLNSSLRIYSCATFDELSHQASPPWHKVCVGKSIPRSSTCRRIFCNWRPSYGWGSGLELTLVLKRGRLHVLTRRPCLIHLEVDLHHLLGRRPYIRGDHCSPSYRAKRCGPETSGSEVIRWTSVPSIQDP